MVENPFSTCTVEQNTEKNLECIAESGTLLCYNQLRIRDMFNYAIKLTKTANVKGKSRF